MTARDLCPDCLCLMLQSPERRCAKCPPAGPEPTERRQSTPQHRDRVHVGALLLLRMYGDDYLKALERATDWTAAASPETFRFYADVATLLSRRYATLTGGRDG